MSKRFNDTELQKFKDGNDPLYPDTDWYDLAYKTGVQLAIMSISTVVLKM